VIELEGGYIHGRKLSVAKAEWEPPPTDKENGRSPFKEKGVG